MAHKKLPIATSCSGCGVCCFHMGFPTFMTPSEDADGNAIAGEEHWYSLPAHLRSELVEYIDSLAPLEKGELDGPCFWLDPETRQCRHHEYRPRVCRDFEIGSRGCQEWREHYRDKIQGSSDF